MRSFSFALVLTLLTTFSAHAAELRVEIQSTQLTSEEQANNKCYQAANAMKGPEFRKETQTLEKNKMVPGDQDAVFTVYSSAESTCIVLENNGANDLAWGLGDGRLMGCGCNLTMEIK